MMIVRPEKKYRPSPPVPLPDRTWPDQVLTRAPLWCSSDLRDGNQALIEPMDRARKRRMFDRLVAMGFKEIEVAFPSASQTDFDFVRSLIEDDLVPEDVTIQVLTPARDDLIARTFDALRGARRAIFHFYNATSPLFRRVVFRKDTDGVIQIAADAARLIRDLAAAHPETDWRFEYSPETFTATELELARTICDTVTEIWQPTPARKAIINLPANVEIATPNIYADQIEWMHRHLARRDAVTLSVHPHNDRGTAVAAAELAVMAGADRVEGCLFGNGERTGNVDLVTLALNLYTQGIDPGLDLSDIDETRRDVELCNQLPVHPRHPYAGDLVFTAFSGSHQDAIKKGFVAQQGQTRWDMPYLPIDPADLGRSYDAVIRVNSQSGKGGVAYLLGTELGLELPRRLQIELARVVQEVTDSSGKEVTAAEIHAIFRREYLNLEAPHRYVSHRIDVDPAGAAVNVVVELDSGGTRRWRAGRGGGTVDAALAVVNEVLGMELVVLDHQRHAIGRARSPGDAGAPVDVAAASGIAPGVVAYVELRGQSGQGGHDGQPVHGVGIDADADLASLRAVLSAMNRLAATARPRAAAVL
jgi:2-isopropylmalate synthase